MDDPIADLLLKIAVQDRTAFRQIYSDAGSKLMGVLLRILGNRAEAEDALQEVFTRVWLRAARFDAAKGRGMTWLIALARNHAIDRLRARRDQSAEEGEMEAVADTTPRAETRLIASGEVRRINACFETLEPERATALRGAYIAGHSYQDLAAQFDVPLNTMRTWLRRSLQKLKECMEQ
jgi:RNA polymerase sigma-70 factor, ECF subfamily